MNVNKLKNFLVSTIAASVLVTGCQTPLMTTQIKDGESLQTSQNRLNLDFQTQAVRGKGRTETRTSSGRAHSIPTNLAKIMMPFESSRQQAQQTIEAKLRGEWDYIRSSFNDPELKALFEAEFTKWLAEVLIDGEGPEYVISNLLANSNKPNCHAYIDQFGESIFDNQPFKDNDAEGIYFGMANSCNLEVATTVTGDNDYVDVPMYLVPLFVRFVSQHEFAHSFLYNLTNGENSLSFSQEQFPFLAQEQNSANATISTLYAEAINDELFLTCYSKKSYHEFFAEATALYFSPLAVGYFQTGHHKDEVAEQCQFETLPEGRVERTGDLNMSGAEYIASIHPNLYSVMQYIYGEAPTYTLKP